MMGTAIISIDMLVLLLALSTTIVVKNILADDSLDSLKPIAMDESIRIIRRPPYILEQMSGRVEPYVHSSGNDGYKENTEDDDAGAARRPNPVLDPETDFQADPKKNLFSLPKKTSVGLAKLITGDVAPTFIDDQVRYAESRVQDTPKKILAHYRMVIPIFVPALRKKLKDKNGAVENKMKVKFVEDTKTEMVPVEKIVQHRHEVIKAEQVPQEIKTDFISVEEGRDIPMEVTDSVQPGEKIVKSVLNNYT